MEAITRTATVIVRHGDNCPDAAKGADWRKCSCRKSILTYDGATRIQKRESAKTRVWADAERAAQEWLDKFDPTKMELKKLKAEKESKSVSVDAAIEDYLTHLRNKQQRRGGLTAEGTMRRQEIFTRQLAAKFSGKLVSEITYTDLQRWTDSWEVKDSTRAIMFGLVKQFFSFCEKHDWTNDPSKKLERPKTQMGYHTVPFTVEQYRKILETVQNSGDKQLETMLELMRWSGMAVVDAVMFNPKSIVKNTLTYKRTKTNKKAVVTLPSFVVALVGKLMGSQPFRLPNMLLESNKDHWRDRLQNLFDQAGVSEVETEVGTRRSHPHMLRDTMAVWYIRHGALIQSVAKMLGDSVKMTEDHYLPYTEEMAKAHVDQSVKILEQGLASGDY